MEDATFRCIDEDFLFPGKMQYVGHEVEEPGGIGKIKWVQGQASANCPNDPFHRIELVEE